jgi:hypothetical protein
MVLLESLNVNQNSGDATPTRKRRRSRKRHSKLEDVEDSSEKVQQIPEGRKWSQIYSYSEFLCSY